MSGHCDRCGETGGCDCYAAFDFSKLEKGKIYLFYGSDGYPLGIGLWEGSRIITIPDTCGCNGIQVRDVKLALPVSIYDEKFITWANKEGRLS